MPGQLHMYMYVTMMMTRTQKCIITENNNIDMMDGGKVFHYKYDPWLGLGKTNMKVSALVHLVCSGLAF